MHLNLPRFHAVAAGTIRGGSHPCGKDSWPLCELAARAGTSLGGTHNEVERLESLGPIRSTRRGRNRLIEAADHHSKFRPGESGAHLTGRKVWCTTPHCRPPSKANISAQAMKNMRQRCTQTSTSALP